MSFRPCPVCRATTSKKEIVTRPPEESGTVSWTLIECAQCGFAYLPNCPSEEALYAGSYYGEKSGLSRWFFEPFNRWWTRRKARRLIHLSPGRRWLDYGCGRGDLLEALKAEGCDIWGVETQKDCAAELGQRWKGHVGTSLKELTIPPEGWDGIVLYHVLEHLENPDVILKSLRQFVHDGAVLFLAVPNWQSWERKVFGDGWFHLDVPRHVQHFSPETLVRLLNETGWTPQKVEFKVTAYDLFGLFQSLLNLGPGPRNYFYRRLKRSETFKRSRASSWAGLLWTIAAFIPAALITLFLTPILALLKRTGTFEVTACAKNSVL